MALPPCHLLTQFCVDDEKQLTCILYQRSCDVGLGVPFNIASYSLLTLMVAHITGLKAKKFVHFMGNTHVYSNHVEALSQQILRPPRPFPVVTIKNKERIREGNVTSHRSTASAIPNAIAMVHDSKSLQLRCSRRRFLKDLYLELRQRYLHLLSLQNICYL
ncbi:UNVERIFIED_CONTAM: hypothetical protein H355_012154 [Colinus virginianus]|nr:hypothetical protein H355_012154 [Colinus virginianus]